MAVGQELRRIPEMPFPDHAGGVAPPAEQLRHGDLVWVDARGRLRSVIEVEAVARWVGTRHQGGAGRAAEDRRVEAGEAQALSGHAVDVRRPDVWVAVDTEVAPALVVGEEHHKVRRLRGLCETDCGRSQQR